MWGGQWRWEGNVKVICPGEFGPSCKDTTEYQVLSGFRQLRALQPFDSPYAACD